MKRLTDRQDRYTQVACAEGYSLVSTGTGRGSRRRSRGSCAEAAAGASRGGCTKPRRPHARAGAQGLWAWGCVLDIYLKMCTTSELVGPRCSMARIQHLASTKQQETQADGSAGSCVVQLIMRNWKGSESSRWPISSTPTCTSTESRGHMWGRMQFDAPKLLLNSLTTRTCICGIRIEIIINSIVVNRNTPQISLGFSAVLPAYLFRWHVALAFAATFLYCRLPQYQVSRYVAMAN